MSKARFFILSGNGFARFAPFEGKDYGVFHVRSFAETAWVEAGLADVERIDADIAGGRLVEFSPASLLASVPSPGRAFASRVNGAKGGRPRKSAEPSPGE